MGTRRCSSSRPTRVGSSLSGGRRAGTETQTTSSGPRVSGCAVCTALTSSKLTSFARGIYTGATQATNVLLTDITEYRGMSLFATRHAAWTGWSKCFRELSSARSGWWWWRAAAAAMVAAAGLLWWSPGHQHTNTRCHAAAGHTHPHGSSRPVSQHSAPVNLSLQESANTTSLVRGVMYQSFVSSSLKNDM